MKINTHAYELIELVLDERKFQNITRQIPNIKLSVVAPNIIGDQRQYGILTNNI